MNLLRKRLGERLTDVLEWVDYRRDASFWPFLALPPMLSVAWAYGGWIGLGILVAGALAVTLSVCALTLLAIAAWVVGKATSDALAPSFQLTRSERRVPAVSPATSR